MYGNMDPVDPRGVPGCPGVPGPRGPGTSPGSRGTPGVSANVPVNVFSLRQCSVNVCSRLFENIGALGRDLSTQPIQPTRTPKSTPTSFLKNYC